MNLESPGAAPPGLVLPPFPRTTSLAWPETAGRLSRLSARHHRPARPEVFRNVCGFSFRPEDDAFAWQPHRFRTLRPGGAAPVLAAVREPRLLFLCLPASFTGRSDSCWRPARGRNCFLFLPRSGASHPDRARPPDQPRGRHGHPHRRGGRARLPRRPGLRISIFLSIFNVHVNRVPRTGKAVGLHDYPCRVPRRPG